MKKLEQEPNCSEIPTGSTTKNDLAVETTQMIDKSNFSQEQYKSDLQSAYDCGYAQAKNDLGVDCISRQVAIDAIRGIHPIDTDYDCTLLDKVDVMYVLSELPPVTPQEPQSFKWCTDCKEYDQEKHCCHRYSKVIRDTIAEIRQEPVFDKLRAEMKPYTDPKGFIVIGENRFNMILNRCKVDKEQEDGNVN